jgi:hypothetical protein
VVYQKLIFDKLAREQAVREEDVVQWNTCVNSAQATTDAAIAELERARLSAAAIYTGGEHGAWAALRKISIRAHSWFNWLYPINF